MSGTRISPGRFVAAIAERLNPVLPAGLVVKLSEGHDGVSVDVFAGDGDRRHVCFVRDEVDWTPIDAAGFLGNVQGGVMELLAEQWPPRSNHRAAEAHCRLAGGRLLMRFGNERAPVIALSPLAMEDVMVGPA